MQQFIKIVHNHENEFELLKFCYWVLVCEIIGRSLAKKIVPYLNDFKKPILTLNNDYQIEENTCPCAFQIRYQGYKGN
ncbi:unnamed protein product [Rotaria sp. Silwood2]|nr:unnamed protein product [Rotaria sp. Silwood2]